MTRSQVVRSLLVVAGLSLLVVPNVILAVRLATLEHRLSLAKNAELIDKIKLYERRSLGMEPLPLRPSAHDTPLDVPEAYPKEPVEPVAAKPPAKLERLPPVEESIRLPTRMVDRVAPGAVTPHLDPTAANIPREQMREITTAQLHDILKRGNEFFVKQFKQPPPPLSEQIVSLQAEGVLVVDGSGYLIYRPVYEHFTRIDIGRDAVLTPEQRTISEMVDKQLATAVKGMTTLDAWPAVISPCDSNGACFQIPGAHLTIPDPVLKQRALDAQTTSVIVWGKRIGVASDGSPMFEVHRLERHDTTSKD